MAQPSHREQLLDGAMQCLKTKGYARTTARDIAAASNANLASIGYHFGSKEALLNEALIRLFEQRNRHVSRIARQGDDPSPLGYLTATFRAATAFKAPRPLFVAFIEAIAEGQHSDQLREQMAAHYRDARRALAESLRANVGGGDPDIMASLLLAVFDGLVLQWLLDAGDTPTGEELITALMDTMSLALQPSTASPARPHKPRSRASRAPQGQQAGHG